MVFFFQIKNEKLRNLDLFNCEVTTEANYRDTVFELLPNIVYLDGFDKDDLEAEDDEEEGEFAFMIGK